MNFDVDTSALAEHTIQEDRHIGWRDASILEQHPVPHSRCIADSWYSNNFPDTLNREKGPPNELYLSLRATKDTRTTRLTTPTNAGALVPSRSS